MASYQFTPPEQFDFSRQDDWPRWIRHFKWFRQASSLTEKGEETQVNTLIYTMGAEDDVLQLFKLSEENQKKSDIVKIKFQDYFLKRRNTIYQRAKFNSRTQESVNTFITVLYSLPEKCDFDNLYDEMNCDRIVVGIKDVKLSERMQLDKSLTLNRAAIMVQQTEQAKEQSYIRGSLQDSSIEAIQTRHLQSKQLHKPQKHFPRPTPTLTSKETVCTRCGKSSSHGRFYCPASEAKCAEAEGGHPILLRHFIFYFAVSNSTSSFRILLRSFRFLLHLKMEISQKNYAQSLLSDYLD